MIITRKLNKIYPGNVHALNDVSVVVPAGEFAFLVGPNGAGKTTFFKLLLREEQPTSGCALFLSRDVVELNPADLARHRRMVGAVFQDTRLVPTMTVFENVLLPLQTEGAGDDEGSSKAMEALQVAGLLELKDRFPADLSGGQQQQVAIARALVNDPKAILADEPTGNLSPAATEDVVNLLAAINQRGITVMVSTHNREIVDSMRRRVLALDRGRLVSDCARGGYPEILRELAA